jgi:hypothetical protein
MSPVAFEPTTQTNEWLQTHASDRAAIGIDLSYVYRYIIRGLITFWEMNYAYYNHVLYMCVYVREREGGEGERRRDSLLAMSPSFHLVDSLTSYGEI